MGKEHNAQILKSVDFNAVTGKGVEAKIDGKNVALGNPKMMDYTKADITSKMKEEAKTYQKQGKTVSYLALDNIVVGYVVIGDKIKKTSTKAIKALQDKGIDVIMLTGDNHDTAQAVASEIKSGRFQSQYATRGQTQRSRETTRKWESGCYGR